MLLTTVNAALQRVPAQELIAKQALVGRARQLLGMDGIVALARAQRLHPRLDRARARRIRRARRHPRPVPAGHGRAGAARFLRRHAGIDPQLRSGDPAHRPMQLRALDLVPVAEFQLTTETIRASAPAMSRRSAPPTRDDLLYEAVSEGRRHPGMEHGCRCSTTGSTRCSTTCRARRSCSSRWPRTPRASGWRRSPTTTRRASRRSPGDSGPPYQPLPPDRLYLAEAEWRERLDAAALARLTPFAVPERRGAVIDVGARAGPQLRRRARRRRRQRVRAVTRPRRRRCRRPASAWSSPVERGRARAHEPRAGRPRAAQLSPVGVLAGGAGAAEAAGRARRARPRSRLRDRRRRGHLRAGHPRRPAGAAAPRRSARPISSPR